MFSERCQLISATITNLQLNIEEFEKQIEPEIKKDEGKRALIPKVENVLDLYPNLQTAEEKNNLLRTIVKRVEYLKIEKAIKKDKLIDISYNIFGLELAIRFYLKIVPNNFFDKVLVLTS